MRKLLTLLLIAPLLFVACGDDDEDEKPYFNPVEGSWVNTEDGKYPETRIFSKNFNASLVSTYDNGKPKFLDYGKYTINTNTIMYNDGDKHDYIIIVDTLQLTNSISGWTKRYIKKK